MFGFWGCGCKDIQQIQKCFPPKKVFGNSEFCSSRQNHSRPNSLENCGFGGKKNSEFPKTFFGGISFCICRISLQPQPQNPNKNIKNYSSILAIVNHRNWLDDSPPSKKQEHVSFIIVEQISRNKLSFLRYSWVLSRGNISLQSPTIISHHGRIPTSLVPGFHFFYILMEPLPLLVTHSAKVFRKSINVWE